MSEATFIGGVVLAGGRGRRLGGGKCLRPLAGRPLIAHAIDRAAPQLDGVVLAVAEAADAAPLAGLGLPWVADAVPGRAGPLAGLLAGIDWWRTRVPKCAGIVSLPCDTPFLPADLVARLRAAATEGGGAVAASAGRLHPVCAWWPVGLADALRAALAGAKPPPLTDWVRAQGFAEVAFDVAAIDPFFNVNAPDDLRRAEAHLAGRPDPPAA